MNLKNKKYLLPILCVIILALCYIDIRILIRNIAENRYSKELTQIYELNEEQVFKISKIIKYSSAEAIDNSEEQNLQDVSIHQYSDIAIFLDNSGEELTEKNTIKELYLDDFNIDVGYKYGTPMLYYKNPLEISKFRMIEENKIQDKLEYEIISTNEENNSSNYDKPVFFADCSNPITLSFIDKDIITNYQVTKENGLVAFDGRIFDVIDLDLKELSPKISFSVHIKNYLDEEYICNASVNLPLETDDGSVKSGYIIQILDGIGYYRFFREK